MAEKIAFISYETPYAPCGGIAAVMGRMPGYLQAAAGLETIVITPYHHRIQKTRSLPLEWVGRYNVETAAAELPVEIGRLVDKNGLAWYFLKADDEAFFAGERHPYDVSRTQLEIGTILQRDALFFGAALARALPVIDSQAHWTLSMQDWEAATVVLALGRKRSRYGLFLTLHNSYDSGGVSEDHLEAVGIDPRYCKGPAGADQASVLERVLELTRTAIFTVSKQFAVDLIQDPVQSRVVAPHLQGQLKRRLYGIDNGPFANLAVEDDLLEQASAGKFAALQRWKEGCKAAALAALKNVTPSADVPVWGDLELFGRDDPHLPWFVMAGRDDPRQKGYDVAALAIRRFLSDGGEASFLFFPIPGDEGQEGLTFLKKLAEEFPGKVLALPFIFKEGFTAALQGATFGLMPSFYEPFGMANEYYLNGTPVIGRATGGIIQQIVPLRTAVVFTAAVEARARLWYGAGASPTGLLFREEDGLPTLEEDWRGINAAGYDAQGGSPDRVEERSRYALVQAMAGQLQQALEDGLQVYQNPGLYFKMLADGVRFIQASFSWERSAQELVGKLAIH
jgi:glycogen synthase